MSISHAKKYSFLSKSRIIQFSNYLELDSSNSESLFILMQYILAVIIVLGTTYLLGRFDEISQGGYFDMWRSFTVIYILGATGYYIEILRYVKKQNKWIEEVKVEQKNRKNT